MMEYWPGTHRVRDVFNRYARGGSRVIEATRLSVSEAHRSLVNVRFLIGSSLAAFFFAQGVDVAFMATAADVSGYYKRQGFTDPLGGAEPIPALGGILAACLVATPHAVIPRLRATFQGMAEQFRAEGRITSIPAGQRRATGEAA